MFARNCLPRSLKQPTLTLLASLFALWLVATHWPPSAQRAVRPAAFPGHLTSAGAVAQVCAAHGFPAAPSHRRQRRVYDLFLLSTELDWLEIRLNSLYQYVDYFVIVEADRTATGLPKRYWLQDHWPKFDTFRPKIIYVPVADNVNSTLTWDHEDAFRNALLYETLPRVAGTEQEPRYGDTLMVSDVDEIPRPETINLLRYCDFPDRLTLRSHSYYYSFQWLHRGEQRAHPQATVYRGLEHTISPKDLRNGEGGVGWSFLQPFRRRREKIELFDAAWHCFSCFRTVKEVQENMQSFSHASWNTEENRDPKNIVDRVRNGMDLFNRTGELNDKIDGNPDVPAFVLNHWQDYRYLLNRDDEQAGFSDVKDLISS